MYMMMNTPYNQNLSTLLAEDVCAPELRNPKNGAIRAYSRGWFANLFKIA